MRKFVSMLAAVSVLGFAMSAFAAIDSYRNAKGEVVQAELKNGQLVDTKGKPLADGEWTWTTGGKTGKVTVKQGKATNIFNPFNTANQAAERQQGAK